MSRNSQPISDPQNVLARPASPAGSSKCTIFPAIESLLVVSEPSIAPDAQRAGGAGPLRSCGRLLLAGRDERAVDRRLGREDLDLGRVHLAPADAGPALGVVARIQILVALEGRLARALVGRGLELQVRRDRLRRRVEVAQALVLRP